jgi:hypothetical protein
MDLSAGSSPPSLAQTFGHQIAPTQQRLKTIQPLPFAYAFPLDSLLEGRALARGYQIAAGSTQRRE